MIIALHKNARTTPTIRAEIAASKDSVAVLAACCGVRERTIRRWRTREVFTDASHTAHRLTKPRTPQTNGMVERFNGRISDVLRTHRFRSGQDMRQTLERYVHLYNHQLPQSALQRKTPSQTMNDWYLQKPELFHRKPPPNHPGRGSYVNSLNPNTINDGTAPFPTPSSATPPGASAQVDIFTYDSRGWLTRAQCGTGSAGVRQLAYDPEGNITVSN